MRSLAGLFGRLDDWCNPIAVKELRQAVQSKFVAGLLILFLVGQLITMSLVVLTGLRYEPTFEAGSRVFMILFGVLLGTCLFFLPYYTGARLINERSAANVDLLFITALRPRTIVWGKLLSGLVLTVLIYSACMPFLTFTYLLRGIDLPSIFLLLVTGFLGSTFLVQFAVFLGCIPAPRQLKPLLSLIGLGAAVMGLVGGIEFARVTVEGDWLSLQLGLVGSLAVILVSAALGLGLFFVLSVAILSPRSANRALPVRIYLTAMWALAFAGVAVWSLLTKENAPVLVWMLVSVCLFSLALAAAVSERDTLGPRVTRTIPRRRWLRPGAFLLYSGSAGGVAWSCLMLGLTALLPWIWHLCCRDIGLSPFSHRASLMPLFVATIGGASLYPLCYCMTALLIRRIFFPRISTAYTWAIAALVAGAALAIPPLARLFTHPSYYRDGYAFAVWNIANPLILTDTFLRSTAVRSLGLGFAALWAVLVAFLNRSWFIRQVRAFRPYEANGGAAS